MFKSLIKEIKILNKVKALRIRGVKISIINNNIFEKTIHRILYSIWDFMYEYKKNKYKKELMDMNDLNDKTIIDIFNCAKEVFCHGIYVPCGEHPCGWDFIDFAYVDNIDEEDNILEHKFDNGEISDGIYREHPYEDKTLKEIIKLIEGKYAFEVSSIDW